MQALKQVSPDKTAVEALFKDFSERITRIAAQSIEQLQTVSENLIESEKELSQIIHGSMIPTSGTAVSARCAMRGMQAPRI